jgi:hypothetical protein
VTLAYSLLLPTILLYSATDQRLLYQPFTFPSFHVVPFLNILCMFRFPWRSNSAAQTSAVSEITQLNPWRMIQSKSLRQSCPSTDLLPTDESSNIGAIFSWNPYTELLVRISCGKEKFPVLKSVAFETQGSTKSPAA